MLEHQKFLFWKIESCRSPHLAMYKLLHDGAATSDARPFTRRTHSSRHHCLKTRMRQLHQTISKIHHLPTVTAIKICCKRFAEPSVSSVTTVSRQKIMMNAEKGPRMLPRPLCPLSWTGHRLFQRCHAETRLLHGLCILCLSFEHAETMIT